MDDIAPIMKHIRPIGVPGYVASLPICAFLSFCMAISLTLKSLYCYLVKPIRTHVDESGVLKAMQEFDHETIEASGGIRLHAIRLGSRDTSKPIMLFLHGFPECSYSWRHQMRHFSAAHRVVAIDMRGFGSSDKPVDLIDYKLETLVADIVAVIKSLGDGPVILVGHDWGGILAWLVAAQHPLLISRLILLAAPHLGLATTNLSLAQLRKSWYILFFQCPYLPEWMLTRDMGSFIDKAFFHPPLGLVNPSRMFPVDIEILKRSFLEPGTAQATVNYYKNLFRHATCAPSDAIWTAMRVRIRVPTLLLMAGKDGAIEVGCTTNLDQVVIDLESKVVDNCSHWIQQDEPEMTNALIDDFLARKAY